MKIIHITPYYPPHMGGLEKTVKELAERSASKGHDVTVFTSNKVKKDENSLVKIKSLKSVNLPGIPVLMPTLPFNILKEVDKDTIVHIHYVLNISMDLSIISAKIKKANIISHIHIDPLPNSPLGFLNPPYKKIFWKNVLPISQKIICPTEEYANIFKNKYKISEEKISIIPPGINISQFNQKPHGDIESPINILFVGRLVSQKNVPLLIKSFEIFKNKYDAKLHIVGDGDEKNKILNLIKELDLSKDVILYGEIPNEEINQLYQDMDMFVLSSNYESFGIVNLEALSSGIPIIASDIPGTKWLKECGILVTPNPENFVNAMEKILESPSLREKLIEKGYETVIRHDWKCINNRILTLYRAI